MTERSSDDSPDLSRGQARGSGHTDRQRKNARQQLNDRSPWNWLLVPAIVVPLLIPLFNRVEPTLFGWPFFYWGQLAMIALGVMATSLVYQKTKTRKDPDAGRSHQVSGPAERAGR